MTTQISKWAEGSKVQGVYYGARFVGTVKSMRQHSKNRGITEIVIVFDVPVKVNNEMRIDCAFYAYADGKHWADPESYVEDYVGGSVTKFKVGDRVEVLIDHVNDPVSSWKLGRIIGTRTIKAVDYWNIHIDGTPILDHVIVSKDDQATHLKHSDAPMPDSGTADNPALTERQKQSGRFDPVTPGIPPTPEHLQDSVQKINELGLHGYIELVGSQLSVSVTDSAPAFQDGDLVIYAGHKYKVNLEDSYIPEYNGNGKMRYALHHVGLNGNSSTAIYRHGDEFRLATPDEKLAYLKAEADRLDTLMAELYDQRSSVVRQIAHLHDEKFYARQCQQSSNFRAKYPTLQDYLNTR